MFGAALKDYVEQLSYLTDTSGIGLFSAIGGTVVYLFHSIVFIVRYFLTFQWLFAFHELPASFKQSFSVILEGKNVVKAGLGLEPNFYPILNAESLDSKRLITGILNGCFLAFPCTIPQILGFRALIINGWSMAIPYLLGTVAGQGLYLFCVLFGLDFVLNPMLDCHPLMLIGGMYLLIQVIFDHMHAPNFNMDDFDLRAFKQLSPDLKRHLMKIFRTNFALAWFENHCVGRYIGNLTFDTSPSLLQTGEHWWLFNTFGYWLGLVVGLVLWSVVWGFAWIRLFDALTYLFPKFTLERIKIRYHSFTTVALMTMAFNTIPYYGIDYLATGPLGLTYQDHLLTINAVHNPSQRYREFEYDKEAGQPPRSVIADKVAFDDDTITYYEDGDATVEELSLESSSLFTETGLCNREELRSRCSDRGTKGGMGMDEKQSVYLRNFTSDFIVSPYSVSGLELPEEENEEELALEVDYLDVLGENLFRGDIYRQPCDATTTVDEPPSADSMVTSVLRDRTAHNPVYKLLLKMDVLPFLGGQPVSHNVNVEDDIHLYEQRTILDQYLTGVTDYKRNITRSAHAFPQHVYNQQFKGSLNVVRQYDAVKVFYPDRHRLTQSMLRSNEEMDPSETMLEDTSESKVLSYNQTLYNRWQDEALGVLHEELRPLLLATEQAFTPEQVDDAVSHMVAYESGPLYFGWDASLRKLLINTSRLPVPSSNIVPLEEEGTAQLPPYFTFQAWPQNIHDTSRPYRLFDLELDNVDQIDKLKHLLGFLPTEDIMKTVSSTFKNDVMTDEDLESVAIKKDHDIFFRRLPQYDWAYQRIFLQAEDASVEVREQRKFIEIGHALPPKLNGVAWPGVQDNRLSARYESGL